jgi:2-iminobutanoate/2-iminopropanoate deaminase
MKKVIATDNAPKAIGPYSQAIKVGNMVFLSGQIPLDPKTGELISSDIQTETDRVLDNLAGVLKEAGCSFDHVVRTTIFLTNLGDFQAVNETYGKRFSKDPPARATVQVSALPRGCRVEIDAVAWLGD